ncbi:putative methyltransferase-domain-containing protein [Boletus reticuloceps]|uniref:Putative methyltransferase-domain-containing protein n=1 Tax=Boletus reticuloceps TaxID=495285 RepID=A0A8I3AAX8_9AGAM|nr:putative methyltransferase-domain-containing protein [Boletus reticuloceps]
MIVPINSSLANLDPSVLSDEIALDEALDALDPLRHLRGDTNLGDDDDSQSIVPVQPRSIQDELIRLSFPDCGSSTAIHIMLRVDAGPGCGGIAWPAGEVRISAWAHSDLLTRKMDRLQVLANYLALRRERYCTGRTILELGSGTGLVGLVAGKLGGKVWITDQASAIAGYHACEREAESARLVCHCVGIELVNKVDLFREIASLMWWNVRGEALPQEIPRPDLILAADCVYFEPTFPLLVKTISELATEQTEILFCYKKRRKVLPSVEKHCTITYCGQADKRFFTLLKKEFNWKEIEDDPSRKRYSREAISLLMVYRKPRK